MATAERPPARPRALGPDGEWTQPPPLNVVAFLGAGLYLRDAQRRAQREERDADADAERPQPLALPPPERPAPPAETRVNDASARDDGTSDDASEPSTSAPSSTLASSSSSSAVSRPVSGGAEFSDASPRARVCRFCFVGEDEEWEVDSRRGGSRSATDGCLVSPCRCSGTQKWVHVGCLRQWQRVSVSSSGAVQKKCMVCHQKFRLPRPPMADFLSQWFSPSATDRLSGYKRAWWQMLTNTIMAHEGTPHIVAPDQLARLVVAVELRIWGGREIRGGNGLLRGFQRLARWCTNAHSVVVITWLASLGAVSVGDALAHRGGPLDQIIRGGNGRPGWHSVAAKFVKDVVGRPLGWALRLVVPGATAAMRVAEPVQGAITWVDRYPQYRVM
jgi:hypothetical protein